MSETLDIEFSDHKGLLVELFFKKNKYDLQTNNMPTTIYQKDIRKLATSELVTNYVKEGNNMLEKPIVEIFKD
jgi:hypothetical protein